MAVIATLAGSIGDRMFQYAFARRLAEYHRLRLVCGETHDWDSQFPHAPSWIDGLVVDEPVVRLSLASAPSWDGHSVVQEDLYQPLKRRFEMFGYFQRLEYYADAFERVSGWFGTSGGGVRPRYNVVIHVMRSAAFARRGWLLPRSYYDQAVRLCGCGSVCVVAAVRTPEITAMCDAYGADLRIADGYTLLTKHVEGDTMILSNDTTTWWAAMLSDATTIVAPHASTGSGFAFTGFGNVDLRPRHRNYVSIGVTDFKPGTVTVHSRVHGAHVFLTSDRTLVVRTDGSVVSLFGAVETARPVRTLTSAAVFSLQSLLEIHGAEALTTILPSLISADICSVCVECSV